MKTLLPSLSWGLTAASSENQMNTSGSISHSEAMQSISSEQGLPLNSRLGWMITPLVFNCATQRRCLDRCLRFCLHAHKARNVSIKRLPKGSFDMNCFNNILFLNVHQIGRVIMS